MSDNPAKSFISRLPTEVLFLIFGQFCGHCRGQSIGRLRDIDSHRLSSSGNEDEDAPRRRSDREYVTKHWCEHHEAAADRYRQDKQSLASLCLVSKALRVPAQSVLHHFYVNGCKYSRSRAPIQHQAMFRFIESTMDTPRLARSVRSLSLDKGLCIGSDAWSKQVTMVFLSSGGRPVPRKITKLDVL